MARCSRCGQDDLPPRRRVCDDCKASPRVSAPAEEIAPTPRPAGLRVRGSALWDSLDRPLDTAAGALALEACRIVDRLDDLDRIIAGKGVLDLMRFRLNPDWWDDDGQHVQVTVKFDSVLAEARQQAGRLTALLDKLGIAGAAPGEKSEEASPLAQVLALVHAAT